MKIKSLPWYILSIAILFYCLDFFFRISPSLVVNPLMQQYHISATGIGIFASAFYIGYVVMQLPAGLLLDRYKLRTIFIGAILICVVSYIGFVYGDNFYTGVGERFVVGLGSAFSFIGTLFIAKRYLPARFFPFIAGVTIALGTLSASAAQYIAALYLNSINWHLLFYAIATFGVILVMLFIMIGRIETFSAYSASQKNRPDKKVIQQLWAVIKNRKLLKNAFIGGMFYLPTSIFAGLWGVSLLHLDYALTSAQGSLAIMLLFLGWAIGAPLVGYFVPHCKHDKAVINLGAFAGFLLSMFLLYTPYFVADKVFLLLFLLGLCSSCQVVVWNRFVGIDTDEMSGTAIAATNMVIMLIVALFHAVVGLLINHHYHILFTKTVLPYSLTDYLLALTIMPIAFLVVVFVDTYQYVGKLFCKKA